jgi:hypothetical protein
MVHACVCLKMRALTHVLHATSRAEYKQQQQHYQIPMRRVQLDAGGALELAPSSMHASHTKRAASDSVEEREQTSEGPGLPRCVSTKVFEWVVQEGDICMKLLCGDGATPKDSDHVACQSILPKEALTQNSDGAPVASVGSSESRV